jgi:hypothetical protein
VESKAVDRDQLRARMEWHGLPLTDDETEIVLGSHREHLRENEVLLRAACATDEPPMAFQPLRRGAAREGSPR